MDERRARVAVDLHCHILPGIDDGARDLADAVAMARQGQEDGIRAICATPHIRHDHDVRIGELPDRVRELSAAVAAAGCRTRILAGGEVAAAAIEGLDDRELRAVSLGGAGRFILLEPDPGPLDERLERAVERLGSRGFRALVAHPERHPGAEMYERLARVIRRGALVQATAASLLDDATRAGILALATAGAIHVLGSDSHSARAGRPVALAEALRVLTSVEPGTSHADWIAAEAPQGIVTGAEISAPFAPARRRTPMPPAGER